MPKLKTNKAVKKRFKITAQGKVKRKRAYRRHLLTDKNASRKRKLRRSEIVTSLERKAIKLLLPYG